MSHKWTIKKYGILTQKYSPWRNVRHRVTEIPGSSKKKRRTPSDCIFFNNKKNPHNSIDFGNIDRVISNTGGSGNRAIRNSWRHGIRWKKNKNRCCHLQPDQKPSKKNPVTDPSPPYRSKKKKEKNWDSGIRNGCNQKKKKKKNSLIFIYDRWNGWRIFIGR